MQDKRNVKLQDFTGQMHNYRTFTGFFSKKSNLQDIQDLQDKWEPCKLQGTNIVRILSLKQMHRI